MSRYCLPAETDRAATPPRRLGDQVRKRLLSRAMASVANPIFITDAAGVIVWTNRAFANLCGYPPRDILGRTPHFLNSGMHGEDFYAELWRTISAGQVWQAETTDRHRDGSLYVVDETITPLKNGRGKICYFVAVLNDITQRKREADQDHHLAYHDPLTGLPNRRHFESDLRHTLARLGAGAAAVIFLDLDKFKPVNDSLGHAVGDLLLGSVAARLRAALREEDLVARVGGDEFAILLHQHAPPPVAAALAAKLVRSVSQPYALEGHAVEIGASAGIACAPVDGASATVLLARADAAMYDAKAAGGRRTCHAGEAPSDDLGARGAT
jgi:diguanylate cyclase (GGDEF)-like protein/PAS domain S-box-containing protein